MISLKTEPATRRLSLLVNKRIRREIRDVFLSLGVVIANAIASTGLMKKIALAPIISSLVGMAVALTANTLVIMMTIAVMDQMKENFAITRLARLMNLLVATSNVLRLNTDAVSIIM